jgi:hypothetical protein
MIKFWVRHPINRFDIEVYVVNYDGDTDPYWYYHDGQWHETRAGMEIRPAICIDGRLAFLLIDPNDEKGLGEVLRRLQTLADEVLEERICPSH